ncbi:hypothetical protein C8A03DRAFT_19009 [Achaetomium macrosporum]|uniref:Uncharacterized protein n=1 Tax=Achaetomium macrosporum TaxID=79813 RepID=A0AAN7H7S8_9PEZI|nr:hypothetical protein C8A03DRAFT_19009 [Achaetomium macrosporum]
MAAYAQNPAFKPLPPPGGYPQGYHLHVQQPQQPQQPQQQHQQQFSADGVHRPPSFVGLPPIRRASTFGSSLGLTAEEFMPSENNAEGAARQQQQQQSQQPSPGPQGNQSQSRMAGQQTGQFMGSSQHSGQYVQSVYRPTQGAQSSQGGQKPAQQGQTWQLQGQNPGQHHAFPNAVPGGGFQHAGMQGQAASQMPLRNFAGGPGNAPAVMNGAAAQMGQGQQFVPGSGRPMMVPPHLLPGNLLQRFHPHGGGWNLQESHLSEPLQPTSRHRRSPSSASSQQQQPYYGLDKETGVTSSTSASTLQRHKPLQAQQTQQAQPTQQTQQQQQQQARAQQPSALPSQENQPPASQPDQAPSASHHDAAGQRPDGDALSRLHSQQSNPSRPGAISAATDGPKKRNSGVFTSIRGRFAGGHLEERPDSENGPDPQGANGDAASVASVTTEDVGQQPNRNPMFGPRGGVPTPDNLSYSQSKDSVVAHGPGTPLGERMSPQPASQFAPPGAPGGSGGKLNKFFGIGAHSTPSQPGSQYLPEIPRSSMSGAAPEHKHTTSIGGLPKKRFSALKDVFSRSSPHDGPKNSAPSFTVRMPAQSPPQMQAQAQYHGQPQLQAQNPVSQGGLSPQSGPMGTPATGPVTQSSSNNAPPGGPVLQPVSSVGGLPLAGQEQTGPATGVRHPGYGLPAAMPPQHNLVPNQNQDRKPSGGIFGFLRGRSDSKSQETPQAHGLQGGPGQQLAFAPGQGNFQGQQLGMRMPLGPQGRPMTATNQQPHPGQLPPQPQFMQPGAPGSAGSLQPQQGQMTGQRQMTGMSQQSGFLQNQQPEVQIHGQRPPMQTQSSRASIQAEPLNQSTTGQPQGSTTVPQRSQPTPQQESAKPAEPTSAASTADSPLSQHSQPANQLPIEQSRLQTKSPVSPRQPFTAPHPGPNQTYQQVPGSQNGTPAPPAQQVSRKPVQTPSGPVTDGSAMQGSDYTFDDQFQRPVSPSSQAQSPLSGIPGEEIEQARVVPSQQQATGAQIQTSDSRLSSRQSPPATMPREGTPLSAHAPGSVSGESAQGSGPTQLPPTQQLNQPGLHPPTNQQATQVPPALGYAAGQQSFIAYQPGAVLPPHLRQQFGPGNVHPNGLPMNAQPKEKEQSTLSKLFKGNKAPNPAGPTQKAEKEKSSKLAVLSAMSAFKRGAKQADTQTPAQMTLGQPAPGQPPAGMQQFAARPQPQRQPQPQPQPQQQQQQQQGPPGPIPGMMARRPTQQQMGPIPAQAPAQPNQQAITLLQGPRQVRPPAPEPQYDQVPIPAGYGYVHGEGRVAPAPAPFYVGPPQNTPAHGLSVGARLPSGIPWVQAGLPAQQGPIPASAGQPALAQASTASQTSSTPRSQTPSQAQSQHQAPPAPDVSDQKRAQNVDGHLAGQQIPPQAPGPVTQQPQSLPATTVGLAAGVSPQSSTHPPGTQIAQENVAPPEEPAQPRPEPVHMHTQEGNVPLPPQIRYTVPQQSSVPPNATIAQGASQALHGGNTSADGIASLPSQQARQTQSTHPGAASGSANTGFSPHSPSPQPIDRDLRAVSPEPPVQEPLSPTKQLTTPTQRVAEDNIYDATPRQSQFPAHQQQQQQQQQQQHQQHQQQPNPAADRSQAPAQQQGPQHVDALNNNITINGVVEPKSAGLSHDAPRPRPGVETPEPALHRREDGDDNHDDLDSEESDMESPIIQSATLATVHGAGQASPTSSPISPNNSTAAAAAKDSVAIFERAKRKAEEQREAERRLVLEEKIPVFDNDDGDAYGPNGRKKDEEVPHMSATSYPGQEWNPYGEGGFEGWDD